MGDVAWTRNALHRYISFIRDLGVRHILIRGNHDDSVAWPNRKLFDDHHEAYYLEDNMDGERFRAYLSHYACRTWRNSIHGSYHIYGHSHGRILDYGRSTDAGVRPRNYHTLPMRSVRELMEQRPFGYEEDGTPKSRYYEVGGTVPLEFRGPA